MSARRNELTREAARLFAQKGYHGTSIGEIADALGVQKGSLYAHIESKQDLLYETMAAGARAFHAGLDAISEELPATEKIRLALRSHLRGRGGAWERALADGRLVRAAVNQDMAPPTAALKAGDEVAFFPPVTGG